MEKKTILVGTMMMLFLVVGVMGETSMNFLTKGLADTLYCALTGCTMQGNLDMNGYNILNATIINASITGNLTNCNITGACSPNVAYMNYDNVGNFNVTGSNATFFQDVTILGILHGGSPVKIGGVNITNNVFDLMENRNSSSRFTLQNLNSGSNATTIITAKNDVGGTMNIGIGSSNFMLGSMAYANLTALFSRSKGNTVFANFYDESFIWFTNPSDDNNPDNLVEAMRLDNNGLNVTGNVTSTNIFIPQYIFSHTNSTILLFDITVWKNITFGQEDADVKQGISHTYNDATNHTFTIIQSGIYDISYDLDVIDTSASASDIDVAARMIFINGTEILGSVFETDIIKQQVETELSHEFLVKLIAGDQVQFQFIASDSDIELSVHATYGDHPESASIVIKKIANI